MILSILDFLYTPILVIHNCLLISTVFIAILLFNSFRKRKWPVKLQTQIVSTSMHVLHYYFNNHWSSSSPNINPRNFFIISSSNNRSKTSRSIHWQRRGPNYAHAPSPNDSSTRRASAIPFNWTVLVNQCEQNEWFYEEKPLRWKAFTWKKNVPM